MRIIELPWQADPTLRFGQFAGQPWSVLLDSCHDQSGQGRYDIFAADPYATLECSGRRAILTREGEQQILHGNPFQLISEVLGPRVPGDPRVPFCGGAIGCFAYELGRACVGLDTPEPELAHPELAMGFYDWAVISDHKEERCHLVSQDRAPATRLLWDELQARLLEIKVPRKAVFRLSAPLRGDFTLETYATAFQAVRGYIEAGDCYQVNLAQRFSAPSEGSLWDAYRRSRSLNPAPFSAYFSPAGFEIASASPERFLRVADGQVETRPIKGTAARIAGQEEEQRRQLKDSAKDRAENLMIVDLLRNDLGKNCVQGSIRVPELFAVESFATVHHLVSAVTGELRSGRTALDLLEGCFPGGSITGAPKRRAMQIIEELEPVPRGVYCGSLAYVGFDGNMDSNIAIRTMVQTAGTTSLHAGGGLTHDSRMEAEYQECLDKAAAMRAVLEVCGRGEES